MYQQLRWAAKVREEKYRANKKRKQALLLNANQEETTLTQMHFLDLNATKQIQQQHEAAVVIQKHFRAVRTRRQMESEGDYQVSDVSLNHLPTTLESLRQMHVLRQFIEQRNTHTRSGGMTLL